jgi:hypothetical protein
MLSVICPLCGVRKARRGCPALGKQICSVCCGTKRLVQIQCPSDCAWLASAREHPPAAILRRQHRDLALVAQSMRDFSERQSQLMVLILTFIVQYVPPELHPLIDEDVAEATGALASTYETASRGLIYEHRPASLSAERLLTALKPVLAEAGRSGGTPFERDVAVVLRRVSETVAHVRGTDPQNARTFVELLGRVIRKDGPPIHVASGDDDRHQSIEPRSSGTRLIVP